MRSDNEQEQIANDPHNLGLLQSLVLRIGTNSRGLTAEQSSALVELLRTTADAIERRYLD